MTSHDLGQDPHPVLIELSYQKQTTTTRSRTRGWKDVTCGVLGRWIWEVDIIMFCFIYVSNSQEQSKINIKNRILDFVSSRKVFNTGVLGSSA